ncbi:GlsB/YeaQ/YmgE family stress response membrane protein [Emcibacter sp.]|uniref:GlsB/YeaQ/YmgE family stress response membrane protein n=1 Tax=Emcibacter sp. TaxID=1979954 RepID=UPI003A940199
MSILWMLIIGALAGFLAGKIMKGGGFGLIGNLVVGIIGAVIGGWLFGQLGISMNNNLIGELVTAVIGAVVLLFIVGLFKKGQA